MATFKDYYAILKIAAGATNTEIRTAYLQRCKEWHPDKHPNADTTKIMQDINEAKNVLLDPVKRIHYDQQCQHAEIQAKQRKRNVETYQKRYEALVKRISIHQDKDPFLNQSYLKEIRTKSNKHLIDLCSSWNEFEAAFIDLVIWELHENRKYDLDAIYSLIKKKPANTSTWQAKEINWGRFFVGILLWIIFQWIINTIHDM